MNPAGLFATVNRNAALPVAQQIPVFGGEGIIQAYRDAGILTPAPVFTPSRQPPPGFLPASLPPSLPPTLLPLNPRTNVPDTFPDPLAPPGASLPPFMPSGTLGTSLGTLGQAGCGLITNAAARALCLAGVGVIGGLTGQQSGTGNPGAVTCPPGHHADSTGRCVKTGVVGTVQRVLPGGSSGYAWDVTAGAFGMPGVVPVAVQQVTRRCPAKFILGADGICYPKSSIPKNMRAWTPPTRPLLTGGDVKILNRAKSLSKKVRALAGKHAPKPRACNCKTRKK